MVSTTYEIESIPEARGKVRSFITTCDGTREICTNPLIIGDHYFRGMREAAAAFMQSTHFSANCDDEHINILHFLRGGLSYGLREALTEINVMEPRSSFMSSERYKDAHGHWRIRDDNYIKLTLSTDFPSTVLIGDIVATGSTLANGLEVLVRHCEQHHTRINNIILFTIGCDNAQRILAQYDELIRKASPEYAGATCVHYEGVFTMATQETPVCIKTPGTDLLNLNAQLAPEYEAHLGEKPQRILQKCVIYDGGSRAFEPRRHYTEVLHYLCDVHTLVATGRTSIRDLLYEQWEKAAEHFPDAKSDAMTFDNTLKNLYDLLTELQS